MFLKAAGIRRDCSDDAFVGMVVRHLLGLGFRV